MKYSPGDITALLNKLACGDQDAGAELVPMVYQELRRLAARRLRSERPDHTLQATALVHQGALRGHHMDHSARLETQGNSENKSTMANETAMVGREPPSLELGLKAGSPFADRYDIQEEIGRQRRSPRYYIIRPQLRQERKGLPE